MKSLFDPGFYGLIYLCLHKMKRELVAPLVAALPPLGGHSTRISDQPASEWRSSLTGADPPESADYVRGTQVSTFTHNPGAVILGGSFASLGAARNLAKHGIRVCVFGPACSVARFSRSLSRFVLTPSLLKNEEVADYLVRMAEVYRLQGSVLFPSTDEQVRIIAQNQSLLAQHYTLTTPSWETVRFLYDKRLTYELAREAGVAIPNSLVPGDAERLAALNVDFPVILKPAITARFLSLTNRKAFRADNRKQLQSLYEKMSGMIGSSQVIVQDLLPEPSRNLFSFAAYFRNGEPIAGLSVKRSRQLPQDFGRTSTFVESVEMPELNKLAGQLLRPIRYTGLAEVEFMWNANRNRFELLEVNARLWAWHSLAIAAGLDLPYLAFADSLGRTPPIGPLRPGAKWVRFLTDLRAAAQGIRSGSLGLPQYLGSLRGTTAFAVFSASDPLPCVVEPFLLLLNLLKRQSSAI